MIAVMRCHSAFSLASCRRPAGGDRVEARLAVVAGDAPFGAHQAALFEAHQAGIKRAHIQLQRTFRDLFEPRRNRVAVLRAECRERLQHHQVERSLQDVGFCRFFIRHANRVAPVLLDGQMNGEVPGPGRPAAIAATARQQSSIAIRRTARRSTLPVPRVGIASTKRKSSRFGTHSRGSLWRTSPPRAAAASLRDRCRRRRAVRPFTSSGTAVTMQV